MVKDQLCYDKKTFPAIRRDINEYFMIWTMEEKEKKKINMEDEYKEALALNDPTKISKDVQETLAREAIKKFRSL